MSFLRQVPAFRLQAIGLRIVIFVVNGSTWLSGCALRGNSSTGLASDATTAISFSGWEATSFIERERLQVKILLVSRERH